MKKRIIITGGHHNSALVVAEELRKRGYEVVWFGHKFTMWGDKKSGAEYREVRKAGFEFIEIKAGKFHRTYHPLKLARLPFGFWQSFYYLLKFKPSLVLSFGGYLAAPVVLAGWFLRVPSMTHEQTVVSGLANRLISRLAKKVFVSWETSLPHFPPKKVILSGLPLRPEIFSQEKGRFDFKNKLATIYLTGGKQGSHWLNQAAEEVLTEILQDYNLIHQCGESSLHDDLSYLRKKKSNLMPKLKNRYLVQAYFDPKEVGQILASANLVISRAGAHTVYEMVALGKPAIFIPLPWSFQDEQTKNAQILVAAGQAEILPQSQLDGKNLLRVMRTMMKNLSRYEAAAPKTRELIKLEATKIIVEQIDAYFQKKKN
jgi:UDP-N-acetylglucosamine--N-acetylmuramyl-(pentapeptide) pyrophosphoryl-undecaprenol N-acetylglucosamine transferase